MSTPPHAPTPNGEIDSAALGRLVQRFRHHHGLRLARTGSRLMARQRRVLEALPMLYHRNHPALPGYVSADVPAGIDTFTPTPTHLAALRRVARGYEEPHLPPVHTDVQAVFIMGSGGTIGQSRSSDVDLWVCCDSLLHTALWPKVRMIDAWAAELGLELHTFLVDPDMLRRRRRLPGTRTPTLLLDEFYRSGALMAGRHPLWWLVPDDDPATYQATAERLLRRRFVAAETVIDFGPVHAFPAAEIAQAAITELDRALTTPHKSLLKLKLMEAYGRAPHLGTVSGAYKARVHAGATSALQLDPYLLLYDHLERYLQDSALHESAQRDQLTFVRGLLIGKAAENARTRQVPGAAAGDAQTLLERFLGWGFSSDDVERLRSMKDWSMSARLAEHDRIMTALTAGLSLVENLAGQADAPAGATEQDPEQDHDRQLHWLNVTRLRHLRFAVDRLTTGTREQIPVMHPALINRRQPLPLKLNRNLDGWIARDADGPVARRRRLVDMVIWAELNGATLVPLHDQPELTRNLAQIVQGFRGSQRRAYVFVNAEADLAGAGPLAAAPADRRHDGRTSLLQGRQDPLGYVGLHQADLTSMDIVSMDDAGHWRIQAATDDAALPDAIGRLLARPTDAVSWQVIGGQARFLAAQRLEKLHDLASSILAAPAALFVLPFGTDTVTVHNRAAGVEVRRHRSLADLRAYVRDSGCSTLGFDPASARLTTLLRAG